MSGLTGYLTSSGIDLSYVFSPNAVIEVSKLTHIYLLNIKIELHFKDINYIIIY